MKQSIESLISMNPTPEAVSWCSPQKHRVGFFSFKALMLVLRLLVQKTRFNTRDGGVSNFPCTGKKQADSG